MVFKCVKEKNLPRRTGCHVQYRPANFMQMKDYAQIRFVSLPRMAYDLHVCVPNKNKVFFQPPVFTQNRISGLPGSKLCHTVSACKSNPLNEAQICGISTVYPWVKKTNKPSLPSLCFATSGSCPPPATKI